MWHVTNPFTASTAVIEILTASAILYLILSLVTGICLSLLIAADALRVGWNALVNGQSDVYTKHRCTHTTASLRLPMTTLIFHQIIASKLRNSKNSSSDSEKNTNTESDTTPAASTEDSWEDHTTTHAYLGTNSWIKYTGKQHQPDPNYTYRPSYKNCGRSDLAQSEMSHLKALRTSLDMYSKNTSEEHQKNILNTIEKSTQKLEKCTTSDPSTPL